MQAAAWKLVTDSGKLSLTKHVTTETSFIKVNGVANNYLKEGNNQKMENKKLKQIRIPWNLQKVPLT